MIPSGNRTGRCHKMPGKNGEPVKQPLKPKKFPERKCIGCGERKKKTDLIRIVRSPEGEISLDFTGRKPGRGAYLCHSVACFRAARKAHRIEQNLTPGASVPDAVYDTLEEELKKNDA